MKTVFEKKDTQNYRPVVMVSFVIHFFNESLHFALDASYYCG